MPVYEYKCESCSYQFELRQKFSDPPADHCPECGASVKKLISNTSFALKGGGWHTEGYKKPEAAPACAAAHGGGCSGCPAAAA